MPTASAAGLLLDTHVWIWLANGSPELGSSIIGRIEAAGARGSLAVQAFSLLEVAMLERKQRLHLHAPLQHWFAMALSLPGLSLVALSPEIAAEVANLPGTLHGDPADRVLAATARLHQLTLVTRDAALIAYGQAGHLRALAA